MNRQGDWPATRGPNPAPRDPGSAPPSLFAPPFEGQRAASENRRRFGRQCRAILERLQRGPTTNKELAAISLKYTGRISDLRAAGYVIECEQERRPDGLATYRLTGGPDEK